MKMRKFTIIILVILLILSLVACGDKKETDDPDISITDKDNGEQKEEAKQPIDGEIDSNVPIYPNSEEVYNDDGIIFYVTSDSGEKVSKFYDGHPYLNQGKPARTYGDGYYTYLTPVPSLAMDIPHATSPEELEEIKDEIKEKTERLNSHIDKHGGLSSLSIFDANMDTEAKDRFVKYYEGLPTGKTLIMWAEQPKL